MRRKSCGSVLGDQILSAYAWNPKPVRLQHSIDLQFLTSNSVLPGAGALCSTILYASHTSCGAGVYSAAHVFIILAQETSHRNRVRYRDIYLKMRVG